MGKLFCDFVHAYCLNRKTDAAFFDLMDDLYFSEEVQGLKKYPQHADINRLNHITGVTYLTYCITKDRGMHTKNAVRGAILHDLFYYDWHDKARWHRPHGYKHPRFALQNAKQLNREITPMEENIILRHMFPLTPIPPKYKEGWVVSFADKYCATCELLIAKRGRFAKRFEAALKEEKKGC